MISNFKRVWYALCVVCGKQATLIDGSAKQGEAKRLLITYGWSFPKNGPHCPNHPVAAPPKEERP